MVTTQTQQATEERYTKRFEKLTTGAIVGIYCLLSSTGETIQRRDYTEINFSRGVSARLDFDNGLVELTNGFSKETYAKIAGMAGYDIENDGRTRVQSKRDVIRTFDEVTGRRRFDDEGGMRH